MGIRKVSMTGFPEDDVILWANIPPEIQRALEGEVVSIEDDVPEHADGSPAKHESGRIYHVLEIWYIPKQGAEGGDE